MGLSDKTATTRSLFLYIYFVGRVEFEKFNPKAVDKIEQELDELEFLFNENPRYVIIGTGQTGVLPLTQKSEHWLASKVENDNIVLIRDRTPLVLEKTNNLLKRGEKVAGVFHTTC